MQIYPVDVKRTLYTLVINELNILAGVTYYYYYLLKCCLIMFLMYYAIKKNNNFKKLDEVKIQIHNLVGFFSFASICETIKKTTFLFSYYRKILLIKVSCVTIDF